MARLAAGRPVPVLECGDGPGPGRRRRELNSLDVRFPVGRSGVEDDGDGMAGARSAPPTLRDGGGGQSPLESETGAGEAIVNNR